MSNERQDILEASHLCSLLLALFSFLIEYLLIVITSKKLSPERIKEIMNFPVTFDEDCPKLTADQIARMKPIRPEYWKVEPVKVSLSDVMAQSG